MSILQIIKMGHPILREKAHEVENFKEIELLIRNMQETLEFIGASGLAAPQVMESKRVIVYRHGCSLETLYVCGNSFIRNLINSFSNNLFLYEILSFPEADFLVDIFDFLQKFSAPFNGRSFLTDTI